MGEERIVTPVTLPRLSFTAKPPPDDNAANAAAIITVRIIRCGRDAWEGIAKAETFDAWKNIGAALAIGKAHALKVTGANAAWGQNYSREFGKWIKEHGFGDMRPSDRSYAIALHEQFGAIVAWRATLSDRERNRLRWLSRTSAAGNAPAPATANAPAILSAGPRCIGGGSYLQ